jgi:hypothetical protein
MTQQMDLKRGLVGHWTMDSEDTNTNTIYDSSAYDNTGENIGTISTNSGKIRDSYSYDGNSYTYLGEIEEAQFQSNDSFTVSAWFNPSGQPSDYPMIISPESSGTTNGIWNILQDDSSGSWNGKMGFRISTDSDFITLNQAPAPLNEWTFFVAIYDGSTASQYVNGELNDSVNASFTPDPYPGDWTIGTGNSTPEYGLDGRIDDVRIYNRKLSEKEIQALYNMRSQRNANI